MKTLSFYLIAILILFAGVVNAQEQRPSPAAKASGKVAEANITINYSSPAVKGRAIWNELVPYGKVWRTGANEATVFTTDKEILIEGKRLPAGEYGLFTIPNEDEWVVIFNKDANQWGAYNYKEENDVLRLNVKPDKVKEFTERMTFDVEEGKKNGTVVLRWENLSLPVIVSAVK